MKQIIFNSQQFVFKLLIFSIVLIFFTGCKKDSVDSDSVGQLEKNPLYEFVQKIPQNELWVNARNPQNPLDKFGNYHNLGLNYLFKNHYLDSPSVSNEYALFDFNERIPSEQLYNGMLNFVENDFGLHAQQNLRNAITFNIANQSFNTSVNYNPQTSQISNDALVNQSLNQLYSILTDTTASHTGSYVNTISAIMSWESQALNNSLIPQNERNLLLITGSIARHSLLYWHEYENANANTVVTARNRRGFLRWLGWGLVAAADCIGGYIGCSIGGPVGAIGLGAAGSGAAYYIFKGRGWEP